MSAFGGLLLTNRGRNLQAKAQTGNQLMFTRMGIGDGELGSSSILDLNALKHEVLSLTLTEFKVLTDGKARVRSILSNQDIATGFYFREIGIYAQDPDLGEILYCYGNAGANAEYIPAGGGPDIIEKRLDVITLIASAANVSAVIDESLIFVTLDDFEAHINGSNPHPQYATDEHMHTKAEISDFPTSMTPTGHKNTHATGGSDELTPADIGAATDGALGGVQGDVAGLQAELDAHLAETVSDVDGAHGLKIEEGNWTPYLLGESTAGTWTAGSGNTGKYCKMHNKVFCTFVIRGTLASAVGNLCLAGLPFIPTDSMLSHGNITANDIATGLLGLLNNGNTSQPRIYADGASPVDAATLSGEKYAYGVFEFNI